MGVGRGRSRVNAFGEECVSRGGATLAREGLGFYVIGRVKG